MRSTPKAKLVLDRGTYHVYSETKFQQVIQWLEANGIDAKRVCVDPPVDARGGRIKCQAIVLDEHGIVKHDNLSLLMEDIDVEMTHHLTEYGIV